MISHDIIVAECQNLTIEQRIDRDIAWFKDQYRIEPLFITIKQSAILYGEHPEFKLTDDGYTYKGVPVKFSDELNSNEILIN